MFVKLIVKIEKWKLEIQRAKSQFHCPHEYKVVLEHKMDYRQRYDVYCPICHSKRENLKEWEWKQIQGIRAAREEYENSDMAI